MCTSRPKPVGPLVDKGEQQELHNNLTCVCSWLFSAVLCAALPHLLVSLAICMMIEGAIALVSVATLVAFALLLCHIHPHCHQLGLTVSSLENLHLEPLQGRKT